MPPFEEATWVAEKLVAANPGMTSKLAESVEWIVGKTRLSGLLDAQRELPRVDIPTFSVGDFINDFYPAHSVVSMDPESDAAQTYLRGKPSLFLTDAPDSNGTGYMIGDEFGATAAHIVTTDGLVNPTLRVRLSDDTYRTAKVLAVAPYEDLAVLHVPDSSLVPALTLKSWGAPESLIHGLGYPFAPRDRAVVSSALGDFGNLYMTHKRYPEELLSPNWIIMPELPVPTKQGFSGGPFMTSDGSVWGTITNLHPEDKTKSMGTASDHLEAIVTAIRKSSELPNKWVEFITNASKNAQPHPHTFSVDVQSAITRDAAHYPWLH